MCTSMSMSKVLVVVSATKREREGDTERVTVVVSHKLCQSIGPEGRIAILKSLLSLVVLF